MTREEFDKLPSDGSVACPDCGKHATHPYPGCGCREDGGYNHYNKWHHTCDRKRAERLTEEAFKTITFRSF